MDRSASVWVGRALHAAASLALALLAAAGCDRSQKSPPAHDGKSIQAEPASKGTGAGTGTDTDKAAGIERVLLISQAQFVQQDGKTVPGPAKLVILHPPAAGPGASPGSDSAVGPSTSAWRADVIEDAESNVFHKAIGWRAGILTIGGTKASIRYWKPQDGTYTAETLWTRSWGGKFDRLRDLELADVTGDGQNELILATHDQGVIAIASEESGTWRVTELGQKPDTFVHEVEVGDVDGDGNQEIYATPSGRNRSDGTSQGGSLARITWNGSAYELAVIDAWESSHAKEILAADLDRNGRDELYVVREAHVEQDESGLRIVDPVRIWRYTPGEGGKLTATEIAHLDDRQSRFLVPADVDGDGDIDLVAAGMNSGLWLLQSRGDGTFASVQIDAESGGFEHATHAADLDGDGKIELYVASDRDRQIRRYIWNGKSFDRAGIYDLPPSHITWNIQDANLSLK